MKFNADLSKAMNATFISNENLTRGIKNQEFNLNKTLK